MVLHIPSFSRSRSQSSAQEVDFLISKNSLITARYDSIDALHYFDKQAEVSEILNRGENDHVFSEMMAEIYRSITDELASLEDWIREIEKNIFEGREKEMVFVISNAGRDLLNFKRIIEPHGNLFDFLEEAGEEKFGSGFGRQIRSLSDEWQRVMKRINNQIDLMVELRETNNSMLSTKQNEIMKQLAVIGMLLLPLTVIGQIFGLSIRSFPLIDHPLAFWIILGLMAAVMLTSLLFAKLKKWM
jgi:magnesium transporter